ncbi:endopeptidase [Bacillus paralicheniformis]|uniref:phage tail protein n=1 Tax=Bacillus paralicheniformis TaxID=1648923 RepID=UPI000D03877D|nr:phage tail protein [Bacillus paralicheniformis]PRS16547.1 endopeptidase [Bacillus paralicheniformis]
MRSLFVRSLAGAFEMLPDFSVKRKNGLNSEKTIDVSGVLTDRNNHSFPLVQNENILVYEEEDYIIKQSTIKPRGDRKVASATAVHRMFVDLADVYIYEIIEGEKTLTINDMLSFSLKGTGYTFEVYPDGLPSSVVVENFGDGFSIDLMRSTVEKFGAEFECVGKTIYIAKEISRQTDYQFRYKFNIDNPSQDIDTSSIKTYIRGYGDGIIEEYTSPLSEVFGIRHASPVRDERYKHRKSLLERIKSELHDYIDISISLTYVELQSLGIQDIRKGDYVWCIIDPFDIDVRIRVVQIEDYSDTTKSPQYTLGTITRDSTDITTDFRQTQKAVSRVVDGTTGLVKMNAVTVGKMTKFEQGYDPSKITMPGLASATTDGLMSSGNYVKLTNITVGPDGQPVVPLANETTNGLMSADDFTKLKNIDMTTINEKIAEVEEQIDSLDQRVTALENNSGGGA